MRKETQSLEDILNDDIHYRLVGDCIHEVRNPDIRRKLKDSLSRFKRDARGIHPESSSFIESIMGTTKCALTSRPWWKNDVLMLERLPKGDNEVVSEIWDNFQKTGSGIKTDGEEERE